LYQVYVRKEKNEDMDQNKHDNQPYSVRHSVAPEVRWREPDPEDGGAVQGVDPIRFEDQLKERAAGPMGRLLVLVFFSLILIHYGAMLTLILLGHSDTADKLSGIFTAWLPVMSGMAGAAAMHYFHERRWHS
jgi:hypothetical protein